MTKLLLMLSASFLLQFTTACGQPSCDDVDCDAGEYCVLYGSDTFERSTTGCVVFPEECVEDETCACLDASTDEDDVNRFCLDFGCDEGAQVSIVCPGG